MVEVPTRRTLLVGGFYKVNAVGGNYYEGNTVGGNDYEVNAVFANKRELVGSGRDIKNLVVRGTKGK